MIENHSITVAEEDKHFMEMACGLARENVEQGGAPFGTIIVKDGELIAAAGDSVGLDNDPTAHAVVNAIRCACNYKRSIKLEGCVVYCSSEPCPMCMSTLYQAGVSRVYYGSIDADAERISSVGDFIHKATEKPNHDRSIPCIRIKGAAVGDSFNGWVAKVDKTGH